MKNYIKNLFLVYTIIFLGVSCEKETELTTLYEVSFSQPIVSSNDNIVITSSNLTQSVVAISWTNVDYPIEASITYTLEFDVLSDAVGDNAWANAIRIEAGEDVLSKALLGNDMNNIATALGLEPDQAGEIVVRVEANLDRKVYSEMITLTVTPYTSQITFPQIYMVGSFQGWNFGTANALTSISAGIFQGYVTFPATQSLDFKFSVDLNWNQSYGSNGSGGLLEGSNVNLTIPNAGSYQITVDLNTMTYTATPYSWGIIGTATTGGWNIDTDMIYDYQQHVWKYTGPLVAGAVKFRLNDSWTINYGPANGPSGETSNGVVLFDNPGAHTINSNGNYEITYSHNPSAPATANYTITLL